MRRIPAMRLFAIMSLAWTLYACQIQGAPEEDVQMKIEERKIGEGSAIVLPSEMTVGKIKPFKILFTVGKMGIAENGAVRIDDPDFNGMGWSISQDYQTTDPSKPGYLSAKLIGTSTASLELRRISPKSNQMRHYTVCRIREAPLSKGDKIVLMYGSIAGKASTEDDQRNKWTRAYSNATFKTYVASKGNGILYPIDKFPVLSILPDKAAKIVVSAPSFTGLDQSFETVVSVLDQYGNPAKDYLGAIFFKSTDPGADLPKSYTFMPEDNGSHAFKQNRFHTIGIQYITVKDLSKSLNAESNPIEVARDKPKYNLYWGDIHGHHGNIFYKSGKLHNEYYDYAKDVANLDFTSETAKSNSYWNVQQTWQELSECCHLYNDPGEFVTFLGFEWMGGRDQGHHCVYFKNDYQPYYSPSDEQCDTLPELWGLLSSKDAITIPHATIYTGFNWSDQNNLLRPLSEIYSEWGSSEMNKIRNIDDSLSFVEYVRMLLKKIYYMGEIGSIQQGLSAGNRMGIIACSDTHCGLPGGGEKGRSAVGGLTAVYARSLTREDIWEGFIKRRTYGTTGVRIILRFDINGYMMGESFQAKSKPTVTVHVVGTSTVSEVNIIKCNYSRAEEFVVAYSKMSNNRICNFKWIDDDFGSECLYYVKVSQDDGNMAWSSPIWVKKK